MNFLCRCGTRADAIGTTVCGRGTSCTRLIRLVGLFRAWVKLPILRDVEGAACLNESDVAIRRPTASWHSNVVSGAQVELRVLRTSLRHRAAALAERTKAARECLLALVPGSILLDAGLSRTVVSIIHLFTLRGFRGQPGCTGFCCTVYVRLCLQFAQHLRRTGFRAKAIVVVMIQSGCCRKGRVRTHRNARASLYPHYLWARESFDPRRMGKRHPSSKLRGGKVAASAPQIWCASREHSFH